MTIIESETWPGRYSVEEEGDGYILKLQHGDWSKDVTMTQKELTTWFLRVVKNTYGRTDLNKV